MAFKFNPFTGTLDIVDSSSPTPPVYTAFTLTNNQSSPADVTGFTVDAATNNGFVADFSIVRSATIAAAPSNGLPDTVFNGAISSAGGAGNTALAVSAMSDNSIIVGGNFTSFNGNTRNKLVKVSDVGVEDSTFYSNLGTGGVAGGSVFSAVVISTTDVLFGGSFTSIGTNSINRMAKVSSAGIYDSTFNGNLGTGFNADVNHIHEQANNQILVCGNFTNFNGNTTQRLVRLNSDGTEDTGFSTNLGTGFDANVWWVYEQADGKILVTGEFLNLNGSSVAARFVRLNSNGTLDTTLNTALGTGFNSIVYGVVEQANTDLLVFGDFSQLNATSALYLVRINSSGVIDSTYTTNLGTGFDAAIRFSQLQSDGKLVAGGGFSGLNGNIVQAFARINTDGTPDSTFEGNQTTGGSGIVFGLVIKPNLKITYAGSPLTWNGTSVHRVFQMDSTPASVTELDQVATFYGAYSFKNSMWMISDPIGAFDDAGVVFSISTTGTVGQIQYTSSNMTGTIGTQEMRFLIGSLL